MLEIAQTDIIVPNFKRRLSGVTATVVRLVPLQARKMAIAATGFALPNDLPQIPLSRILTMSRHGPQGARIWHARRNNEMLPGLFLKHVLRKRLKLVFTSAAQRHHTGYTKWLIRQMDAVIATSDKSASYLERACHVIRHGIDADLFSPCADKRALRRQLGLPEDATLIGCYGRVRPSKGNDIFVDAMLQVLPNHPNAVAVMMGGVTEHFKSYARDLSAKINASPVADQIKVLPEVPVSDMARYYQALDLYVAPQRWEGFGLTPLEAMACAVPVIATRVGAFEELVADGETGCLVDIEDTQAIASRTHALLADPKLRSQWADAARTRARTHFRIDQEADAISEVYTSLLAQA